MKKLLLALIVSLVFCGSIFAQHPNSRWPGFDYHAFEMQGALYASLMIDGVPVDVNYPNWDQMEVAAFVGDELRMTGMYLTDEYVSEYSELFPTLNGEPNYYTNPGEVVSFKMFNHATGVEYGLCQALIYEDDDVTILTGEEHWEGLDDMDHPLMLNFTTLYSQTIALSAGANWVSFNVDITLDDLEAALLAALPDASSGSIEIKAKYDGSVKYQGNRWRGTLASLDMAQSYRIKVGSDCEITLGGMPIDPTQLVITIKSGANWIPFPFSTGMTVADAFAGFAVGNDQVKSKNNGDTKYQGSRWRGNLTTLVPGQGYTYNSASSEDRPFVYPVESKAAK